MSVRKTLSSAAATLETIEPLKQARDIFSTSGGSSTSPASTSIAIARSVVAVVCHFDWWDQLGEFAMAGWTSLRSPQSPVAPTTGLDLRHLVS